MKISVKFTFIKLKINPFILSGFRQIMSPVVKISYIRCF